MSNIVLVGFMGTGKSTIGRLVAEKLSRTFLDSDKLIESEAGTTINNIFSNYGESYFREVESKVIQKISQLDNCVIATGGGVVLSSGNMKQLGGNGIIICLKAKPEVIYERTKNAGSRPLLNVENPSSAIENKLNERKGLYTGDLVLDTSRISAGEAADRIISFVCTAKEAKAVNIALGSNSYKVLIGSHLLSNMGRYVSEVYPKGKILIVSNPAIYDLWGKAMEKGFEGKPYNLQWLLLPDGEEYKSLDYVSLIYDKAIEFGLDRKSLIIAFGGGVIGDIAGFAASTYLRGIAYIQVPTTLLAQVDSSIGGKTAVNHSNGKNLIGSFYQPKMVISDTSLLVTLPERELSNGLAEVVKYGIIWDKSFFGFLETEAMKILALEQDALTRTVETACRIKALIVERDEKEAGQRMLLNYGHTIGHAVEVAYGYKKFRHGEAVSVGMEGAADIAVKMKILSEESRARQRKLLQKLRLPICSPGLDVQKVLQLMSTDKKVQDGRIRFILPKAIGCASVYDNIPSEVLESSLQALQFHSHD